MLTPKYLQSVADPLIKVYSEADQKILSYLAKRLVQTDYSKTITEWQFDKINKMGQVQTDVRFVFNETSLKSNSLVKKTIADAGKKSILYDDAIYIAVGLSPLELSKSPYVQSAMMNGAAATTLLLNSIAKRAETAAKSAYNKLLDKIYINSLQDANAQKKAIIDSIKALGINGIEKESDIQQPFSGIESAVRRAVVTGVNKTTADMQIERAEEVGCQLVKTSAHLGARPTHQVWQGKVFCITGSNERYGNFYTETGYGTGPGLCGWNCRHSFYPYFEGYQDRFRAHVYSAEENAEEYTLQQRQRYYERMIRLAKRELATIDAAVKETDDKYLKEGLYSELDKATAKLRRRENLLTEFINANNLVREKGREIGGGKK